jgi:hypothetical protein
MRLVLLSILILVSCQGEPEKINPFAWLVGEWTAEAHDKTMVEKWEIDSNNNLVGSSFLITGLDTVLSERMIIQTEAGKTTFRTVVEDQNDQEEISFALIENNDSKAVFENKEHDFPQRIVYTNPQPDSLVAYIEGTFNGTANRVNFNMKRR